MAIVHGDRAMKLRIKFDVNDVHADDIVTGKDSEDVVRQIQAEAAANAPFLVRLFINRMSPLQFAQEVVGYYSRAINKPLPKPQSCDEFIVLGEQEGIVSRLEDS